MYLSSPTVILLINALGVYKSYPEFKETNMMMDDMLLTVVDEAELAGEAKGEIKRSLEIAQELIKEGWTSEKIARMTKSDLLTVESLYGGSLPIGYRVDCIALTPSFSGISLA
jgi:hypothetical protein